MKSDQVAEYLRACGVTVEVGPVAKAGALGPIMSCYCRDPDGNLIEIANYSG
jgi:catechol 2,3-dioxygenase-like lactoylglutathione lyase family enzyme